MDIKQLKPNKNSRFKQGYYKPSDKYIGRDSQDKVVIYRSSLELKFCNMCDASPKVIKWSSETIAITYEFDKKLHTYWPDYTFTTINNETYLIEVKPYHESQCPHLHASNYAKETYRKNVAKWNAAIEYCNRHNMKFKIITEKFFQR